MADGSTLSLIGGLVGNLAVAGIKFAAFLVSGSSAMLTEAIHSVVDSLNQVLLLFGQKMGRRPADASHPFGHGLETYFWTFVVAMLMFVIGGALGIVEGVIKLLNPEPAGHLWLNLGVIAVSAVLEAGSLYLGVRGSRQNPSPIARRLTPRLSFVQLMRYSKDPGIYEVLAENAAALIGLVFAAAGVLASNILHLPQADGAASIAIGVLLIGVAIFLIVETRSLLTGEAAAPAVVEAIERILTDDSRVDRVCEVRSMHMGPLDILVAATLDFKDSLSGPELEAAADELTRRLKETEPRITSVFLRPGEAAANQPDPRRDA